MIVFHASGIDILFLIGTRVSSTASDSRIEFVFERNQMRKWSWFVDAFSGRENVRIFFSRAPWAQGGFGGVFLGVDPPPLVIASTHGAFMEILLRLKTHFNFHSISFDKIYAATLFLHSVRINNEEANDVVTEED